MNNKTKKLKISEVLIYSILFTLPVIQIGFSYYISIQFFVFIICASLSINSKIIQRQIFILMTFVLAVFSIKVISMSDRTDLLIPLREMVCLITLILVTYNISYVKIKNSKIQKFLTGFLIITFLLVILQKYFISKGIYFGIPIKVFIMNQGTLEGVEKSLLHETRLRPTSFYGEPSYTSWIIFSILTIILLSNKFTNKNKYIAIIICLLITILSESFSGIIAIILFMLFWFINITMKNKKLVNVLTFIIVFGIIISLVLFLSTEFQIRLLEISNNSDESFNVRLLDPFLVISKMNIKEVFFGVNTFVSKDLLIDNALLGLIIHYGILSIFIFIVIFKLLKDKMLVVYFLIALSFNGSIFSYDKVLVLGLVIGLIKAQSKYEVKSFRRPKIKELHAIS